MLLKIFIGLILFIILVILIPLKIEIKYFTKDESKVNVVEKAILREKRDNYARIYLMSFLPLPKIKLQVKKNAKWLEEQGVIKNLINTIFSLTMEIIGMEKVNSALLSKKDLNTLINSIYFKKLNFSLGYNLQSVIYNAYFMAMINSFIAIVISRKDKMFSLKDVSYNTYISNQIYNFKIYSILKFKLANTIGIFIKVFIKLRKVAKEYGKGKTSYRRFNDDGYDVT